MRLHVTPRVFVAKKVKRKKYRGLGNERISRVAKNESAKVIVMENKKRKTASRKMFRCSLRVREEYFSERERWYLASRGGDILLTVRERIKNEEVAARNRSETEAIIAHLDLGESDRKWRFITFLKAEL